MNASVIHARDLPMAATMAVEAMGRPTWWSDGLGAFDYYGFAAATAFDLHMLPSAFEREMRGTVDRLRSASVAVTADDDVVASYAASNGEPGRRFRPVKGTQLSRARRLLLVDVGLLAASVHLDEDSMWALDRAWPTSRPAS